MIARYAGTWDLGRSIIDLDTGDEIHCAGTASLVPDGPALAYSEAVSYRLAQRVVRATRAYRFASVNGVLVASFADGSPFFTLRIEADGTGRAVHDCAADRYELRLDAGRPGRWNTRWDVRGTKRLRILTRYTRDQTSTIAP